ncbi:MAG: hypothetical protein SXV54_20315 [Chloroflexota bacterium]|nr:hypothetical protein [Chloroflexota bacterium]
MEDISVLKEFARGLVAPGCQVRALVVREPIPDLKLEPGDLVVLETGRTWPDGETWLVVRRWQNGQYQFSFTRSASPEEVRGRILFTVHEPDT